MTFEDQFWAMKYILIFIKFIFARAHCWKISHFRNSKDWYSKPTRIHFWM